MTPDIYPQTALDTVFLFIALAIMAPVGEEVLFRGVIQRGYERRSAWTGIVVGGLLFAFYHIRFQGLPALLPIAFILGYVVWRSNSLVTGMLVHVANNALSAAATAISAVRPDIPLPVGSLPLALAGGALTLAGLVLMRRWTSPLAILAAPGPKRNVLLKAAPLLAAAVIYTVLAGSEVILYKYPEVLSGGPLQLPASPWQQPLRWRYEVRNIQEQPIGEAECALEPAGELVTLDCRLQQQAFKADTGSSHFDMAARTQRVIASWDASSLHLQQEQFKQDNAGRVLTATLAQSSDTARLNVVADNGQAQELEMPANALLTDEWPWRAAAIPFSIGYSREVGLVALQSWQEETKTSGPALLEAILQVVGAEPLETPAGNFMAWHVKVGTNQNAWYDVATPHTLLQYDNGVVRYVLK